jgi:tetratricopeptide (TPR) repeat protein
MAYVRKKGNQVAIVQGDRDADTGEVVQKTLFTFFSKAEAYRAVGRGSKDQSHYFQNLLQDEHPAIKFNWMAINKGIIENLEVLPDLAEYREHRLTANFKNSLHAFSRELVQSDPQSLVPASKLLLEHKRQLEFLRDVIDMKLGLIDTEEHQFNGDNEFYWRQSMHGWGINSDVEEMASDLYQTGDHDAAIAAFTLLTESFPGYAEGHNYLGLIYLDRANLDASIDHFRKTVQLGRKMFPKRIQKDMYWSDHKTRPYIRGLRNLALALTRNESFEDALAVCSTLENECNDAITAACHRAAIFLNTKNWPDAEDNALRMINVSPMEATIAAFAQFEQGKLPDARKHFLFAAFNNPLGIEMVLTGRARKPKEFLEAEDYNGGIELRAMIAPYLGRRSSKSKTFFSTILGNPEVQKFKEEARACAINHSKVKDEAKHRANFDRWHVLIKMPFAEKLASEIGGKSPV